MDFLLSVKGDYLQRISYCREDSELIRKGQCIYKKVENEREMEKYRRYWKPREGRSYDKAGRKYLIYGVKNRQGQWCSVYRVVEYCMERKTYRIVGYYKKEEQ